MFISRLRSPLLSGLALMMLLSGCASTNNPRDPLEPLNRAVYQVNDALDKVIMKPVATVYKTVLPQFVRTGVTNFFSNLYDILTALNNLLQGKFGDAVSDTGRIALNSTVGILGLIDVGTEVGLEKHKEDFGQTMGRWGVADGPYLQVPFFGPSSFRDAVGTFVDFKADPIKWIWRDHVATRNSIWGRSRSICAPTCSTRPRSSRKPRLIRMNSSATPTCSAVAIWSMTATRRPTRTWKKFRN